jgi:hypothetical protein
MYTKEHMVFPFFLSRILCSRAGNSLHGNRHSAPLPHEILHRGDENPLAACVSKVFLGGAFLFNYADN